MQSKGEGPRCILRTPALPYSLARRLQPGHRVVYVQSAQPQVHIARRRTAPQRTLEIAIGGVRLADQNLGCQPRHQRRGHGPLCELRLCGHHQARSRRIRALSSARCPRWEPGGFLHTLARWLLPAGRFFHLKVNSLTKGISVMSIVNGSSSCLPSGLPERRRVSPIRSRTSA